MKNVINIFNFILIICLVVFLYSCKTTGGIDNSYCEKYTRNAKTPAQEFPMPDNAGGIVGLPPISFNGTGDYYIFSWAPVPGADSYTLQIFDVENNRIFKEIKGLTSDCYCYEHSLAQSEFSDFFKVTIHGSTIFLGWKVIAYKKMKKSTEEDCAVQSNVAKFVFLDCGTKNASDVTRTDPSFSTVFERRACDCLK